MIPEIALDYIKQKNLQVSFSYKDVWHEEHTTAFTVAKAMQVDVVSDIKTAVKKVMKEGQTFEQFQKDLKPLLQKKGWWGKKDMTDPLTGKTVNVQLGSDRRLKTIYHTNVRSAYLKAQYDRSMASTSHPYFLYVPSTSNNKNPFHKRYYGLVLLKEDPFWDLHLPQKQYGCNCNFRAVSKTVYERYEKDGIPVAPSSETASNQYMQMKRVAPPEEYTTFVNERKGTIEKVPKGVHPSFNYPRSLNRNTTVLQGTVTKIQEKAPEQFDDIMNTLFTSRVNQKAHVDFIDNSLKEKADGTVTEAVGFFDKTVMSFLVSEKLSQEKKSIIMLQRKLVNSKKYKVRHTTAGNAPSKDDWYKLTDYLLDASVYFDGIGLIYLYKKNESEYVKIVVDVDAQAKHKGTTIFLPKVDTMYLLDISNESDRGIKEYNRITNMKKIK